MKFCRYVPHLCEVSIVQACLNIRWLGTIKIICVEVAGNAVVAGLLRVIGDVEGLVGEVSINHTASLFVAVKACVASTAFRAVDGRAVAIGTKVFLGEDTRVLNTYSRVVCLVPVPPRKNVSLIYQVSKAECCKKYCLRRSSSVAALLPQKSLVNSE